ncbi:MAG: RNA polymerase sigma factor [Saprospirales bacterium]|jgi:RNA polymerase sigma-70 factor (ECF subfamily)|nr:RNA polymerase sigma factor [Saprospirales bacterium]MBK6902200.1 RNA polymerase sigma factor [Saprospirales bacterium]
MTKIEFSHKFLQLEPKLLAFAQSLTKDQEAALDLYQETAYKAFRHRDHFQPATNLKAWLMTIMKNTFINHYRRKKRQQTLYDHTENDILLNTGQTSENSGEGKMLMEEITTAIGQLEEHFRVPFLMQYQGFHYEEISSALQIPLGTVKSRIHFARKHLRTQLQSWYQSDSISGII